MLAVPTPAAQGDEADQALMAANDRRFLSLASTCYTVFPNSYQQQISTGHSDATPTLKLGYYCHGFQVHLFRCPSLKPDRRGMNWSSAAIDLQAS
jgi:hypothetical protein